MALAVAVIVVNVINFFEHFGLMLSYGILEILLIAKQSTLVKK